MPRGPHPSHRTLTAAGSTVEGRRRGRVLRRAGLQPRPIDVRVTLPRATWTVPLARRLLRNVLRCPLAGDDCRTAVEIALGEACANAVRHADPATHYEVHLRVRDATCLVEVTDAGTGFALHYQPAMPAANTVSGRGLAIIARFADELNVEPRHPSGTLLRFVKHLYG